VWAQPIIVSQYKYGSSVLNSWDGSMKLDEENDTILSTMVGAGRKNKDNKFEGVLMGDVVTVSNDKAVNNIGLYGFYDGAQSFGFKVDGTAFIGKSGKGRIEFDGINSTITSSSYKNGGVGVKIDLDTSPYLSVRGTKQELLRLSDTECYLQSDDYETSSTGMKIDLTKGSIDAYNFKLTSGNFVLSNKHISPKENSLRNWYGLDSTEEESNPKGDIIFKAGNDKFAITNGGHFYAEAGRIANWNIGTNSLTVGSIGLENSFCLYANGSGVGTIYDYTTPSEDNNKWALGIGSNFGVLKDGSAYMSKGKIGSFEITETSLSGSGITLTN
jgi:hypothetical protein